MFRCLQWIPISPSACRGKPASCTGSGAAMLWLRPPSATRSPRTIPSLEPTFRACRWLGGTRRAARCSCRTIVDQSRPGVGSAVRGARPRGRHRLGGTRLRPRRDRRALQRIVGRRTQVLIGSACPRDEFGNYVPSPRSTCVTKQPDSLHLLKAKPAPSRVPGHCTALPQLLATGRQGEQFD